MVEWVGLVASSFQFFTRLAAVFAEEVGGFSSSFINSFIQRCFMSHCSQLFSKQSNLHLQYTKPYVPPKFAVKLFKPRCVPCHNLPLAAFPHPDIREAAFLAKRFAVFVRACSRHVTSRNRKVLAVNTDLEGGVP